MDKEDRLRESADMLRERAEGAVGRALRLAEGPWASVEMEGDWHASQIREIANAFERRGYRVQVEMWEDRFIVLARKREGRLMSHIAEHDREHVERILDAGQDLAQKEGIPAGRSTLGYVADVLERFIGEGEVTIQPVDTPAAIARKLEDHNDRRPLN